MGKNCYQSCQLSSQRFVRVEFQGSRMSAGGGLVRARELDERLGV
jgi:hypothetical protein